MGFIKKIFYGIMVLLMALCAMILLCALNPKLTESLATMLYGNDSRPGIIVSDDTDGSWGLNVRPESSVEENEVVEAPKDPADIISGLLPDVILPEEPDKVGNGTVGGPLEYVPYESTIAVLPENVGNLVGYQPIEEVKEQIGDSVAKALVESLGTGPLGEEYEFDPLYYPYYAMLSAKEQKIYRQLYANGREANAFFAPIEKITTREFADVFEAVVCDHPELFFMETAYSVKHTKNGQVVEVDLSYYILTNDIAEQTARLEESLIPILQGAMMQQDPYKKARYVHNLLISQVEYDDAAGMNQSAVSALKNGKSVCAGYARAYQYILQKLDVPCYYCVGFSGEDHAWNIIKLPDGYYNVDVTWDDTDPSTYDYFVKTDSDYAGTHVRKSLSVNLPPCQATGYRGLEMNGPNGIPDNTGSEDIVVDPSKLPMDDVPVTPMEYDRDRPGATTVDTEEDELLRTLEKLGLKKEQINFTVDNYYADCGVKMAGAGVGQQQFVNVVSKEVYDKLESIYGSGAYENGYVLGALEKLGMNHFTIQIQAQDLGSGFYKLYHNIVTWYE